MVEESKPESAGPGRPHKVPGAAPGTLTIDPGSPSPIITAFGYGPDDFTEVSISSPSEVEALLESWPAVWVNVEGLGEERVLREIAGIFDLHRLTLEDVVSAGQRPKVEPFEAHLFVVARMPAVGGGEETEQLSLYLGERYLLSLQERRGDWFDPVRERIRHGRGIVRRSGVDYLAYALLDTVIDAYFPVIEKLGDEIEELEDEVLESPEPDTVEKIHEVKRRLLHLRRVIGPHREAISALLRDATAFVTPETTVYLRDCYDHLLRLTERVEIYREQCADLMGTHLSMASNRMNEVMRVLTVMASIFIPLSFLAGVYGMNFDTSSPMNLPELRWRWGYPMFWAVIVAIASGMVYWFRRKSWW